MPEEKKPAANMPVIDRAYLDANHADLVTAIRADAAEEASQNGINNERERVLKIINTPLANTYGEIIIDAITNGKTAEQVALAILDAESKGRTDAQARNKDDAPAPLLDSGEQDLGISVDAPIEDRAKVEWDKSPNIRKEFANNYESYLAYRRAEDNGQVKVLGK